METDRGAVLTVRAAARGLLDFSRADPRDIRWWRRSTAVVRSMHRDDGLAVVRAALDYQLAMLSNGGVTEETFRGARDGAYESFNDVVNIVQPWAANTTEELKKQGINELLAAYKETFGDPNDPEFQRKLAEGLAEWKRLSDRHQEETEEERINRLLLERDARSRGLRG